MVDWAGGAGFDTQPGAGARVMATILFTDIVDSTVRARKEGDAAWKQRAATQRARAERGRVKTEGGTRLLGVTLIAGVVVAYAVAGGAVYLLVTSVSGQLLVTSALLILLFYFALLVVLRLPTMTSRLDGEAHRDRATDGHHRTLIGVSK